MRPLILHNVPDEELYTGEDGIQRPYAIVFPEGDRQPNLPRTRRAVAETGAFGKSMRRSRSRTGSAPPKREDATMQSADKIFSDYLAKKATPQDSSSHAHPGSQSQPLDDDSAATQHAPRFVNEPTEVILRGYLSPDHQYAALNHYELLAGRICEDYPRDPPVESRRYRSELRDPAFTRRQALTPAELAKVNRYAGGNHWIKITFESADAADAAIYASPQKILGHLVYAEPFHGMPPPEDAPIIDVVGDAAMIDPSRSNSFRSRRRPSQSRRRGSSAGPGNNQGFGGAASGFAKSISQPSLGRPSFSDNNSSQASSQTFDTTTMSNTASSTSTATATGSATGLRQQPSRTASADREDGDGEYSSRIPGARRVKLKPAEEALAPQATAMQRMLVRIPLIGWFSGSMIGNEVPRNEMGEFDLARASLFWRLMFYLDLWFGLFGSDLVTGDKED